MLTTSEAGPRRYLTVEEFIAENKRHGRPLSGRTALYDALRQNAVPHIRVGRKILIPSDAFDLMLVAQQRGHEHTQPAV